MKKTICLVLSLCFVFALAACGGSSAPAATAAPAAPAEAPAAEKSFTVGICQLVQHPALDAATQGFKDALSAKLGDKVSFLEQNASGDSTTCATICNQFVSEQVELIMANATPALQAAAAATNTIPVLATSITDFGSALGIDDWTGVTGMNISGTSDLAPLDGQAQIARDLFPEAKSVGVLFCSGEANSLFQADSIQPMFEAQGLEVTRFTFSDSNDVAAVVTTACGACDVLYIPTDNTAASCAEAINNVALNAKTPIVCGEENLCKGCGVATLSITYFDLGTATGEMAAEILLNGADVSQMEVRFAPQFTKEFNADICSALGITPPADFVAIG